MIIEEIRLRNIRSHTDSVIQLKEGINLIHGDIGAGKSSILYAIEFALFGTGSRFGKNEIKLLRAREKNGFVEVKLSAEGKSYMFHREIKDGYDKGGWIIEEGVKRQLSAVELRKEALEILKLREPKSSRSKSYIYEYAIFTPQEEMKRILEDKPEDRMKLLRKAFGLTDYASARDNAHIVIKAFEREKSTLEAQIREILPKREELANAQKELESIRNDEKKVVGELERAKGRDAQLREKIAEWEIKERELQEAKITLQSLRNERQHLLTETEKLKQDLAKIDGLKKRLKALEVDYARYSELENAIKVEYSKKAEKENCGSRVQDLRDRIKKMDEELSGYRREISEEGEVEKRIEELRKELAFLKADEAWRENAESLISISKDIERLNERLRELDEEERSYRELSGQKVCPKCGQKLTEEHVQSLISKIHEEREKTRLDMKALEKKKAELEGKKSEIEKARDRLEELNRELQKALSRQSVIDRIKSTISEREKERKALEAELSRVLERFNSIVVKDITALETELKELRTIYDEYVRAKGEVEKEEELQKELDSEMIRLASLEEEERTLEAKIDALGQVSEELVSLRAEELAVAKEISTLEERLKNIRESIKKDEEKIRALEKDVERLVKKEERLKQVEGAMGWLERFADGMETIEKNVVNFLNKEFQIKFQELFSMLIDTGEITVEVDESFTPMIKENGMDININSLSGGERTSVAMAYRLALNRTVQRESTGMEESTIILDEPTDGFSAEQLDRFGELLRALGCRQVILVSHEEELLSCADNVIRVKKEDGISRVI